MQVQVPDLCVEGAASGGSVRILRAVRVSRAEGGVHGAIPARSAEDIEG